MCSGLGIEGEANVCSLCLMRFKELGRDADEETIKSWPSSITLMVGLFTFLNFPNIQQFSLLCSRHYLILLVFPDIQFTRSYEHD